MSRSQPSSKPEAAEPDRGRSFPVGFLIGVAVVGGLVWLMQSEANHQERLRALRELPGGDAWLTEQIGWAEEGPREDERTIWLGAVDELKRTNPETGEPELLALTLIGTERLFGSADKRSGLYVTARDFDFVGLGMDEPLTGHLWLVATFRNVHDQRLLHAAMPAPLSGVGKARPPVP